MIIKCYCDASFDPRSKKAVIGWKIGNNNPQYRVIVNTKNTRAEIHALIDLIQQLDPTNAYIIFTDCESIVKRLKSPQKLIDKQFRNKRGQLLSSADLYEKLFNLVLDQDNKIRNNLQINHIAGHVPKAEKKADDIIFSELDISVRSKLRTLLSLKRQ